MLRIITLYFSYACNSTSRDIFLGILYGYKMMLQIVALVLALSIHEVKVKGLNDAKYIAAAIYVTSIEVAIIIICVYTLSGFVNWFVAVISTVDFLGTTVTLGLVFVTKVRVYIHPIYCTVEKMHSNEKVIQYAQIKIWSAVLFVLSVECIT